MKGESLMKPSNIFVIVLFVVCIGVLLSNANEMYTYEKDIEPILYTNCYLCHCQNYVFLCDYESAISYVGEVHLKTIGLPMINVAKPDSSVIIWRLKGELPSGEDIDKMPPFPSTGLTDEEIQKILDWIKQGAPEGVVEVDDTMKWRDIKLIFK